MSRPDAQAPQVLGMPVALLAFSLHTTPLQGTQRQDCRGDDQDLFAPSLTMAPFVLDATSKY